MSVVEAMINELSWEENSGIVNPTTSAVPCFGLRLKQVSLHSAAATHPESAQARTSAEIGEHNLVGSSQAPAVSNQNFSNTSLTEVSREEKGFHPFQLLEDRDNVGTVRMRENAFDTVHRGDP
ncbi:hypothetical protein B0H14DRAFT_2599575 [Mycena olivaceomarginata]|nr:hypothetical protein B0H14DRAFT_2599575 [Mycena olivaceomarginata]